MRNPPKAGFKRPPGAHQLLIIICSLFIFLFAVTRYLLLVTCYLYLNMTSQQRQRVKILDVFIDILTPQTAIARIEEWVRDRKKAYVAVAPVSTVVAALDDEECRRAVNGADMVTPDGMPVVWAARMKGCKDIQRVCGPDLMRQICVDPCLAHLKHFFFGSSDETLSLLKETLREQNPDIKITGSYAPLFCDRVKKEEADVIRHINQADPDIVWVGLGSPKQDLWMSLHRDELNASVLIGIGAAFDFLAGVKPRAPKWMQKIGLEWLFRLCCEPRRLWRRYLIGNARFVWEILKRGCGDSKGKWTID